MNFTDEQRYAVNTEKNHALVIAGAGSGKTSVLIERVAHLVEDCRESPYDILMVTFTRNASAEMRARLDDRLRQKARGVDIGTFHSIAMRHIQRFGEMIGFTRRRISVFSEPEERFVLDMASELSGIKFGTGRGKANRKSFMSMKDKVYAYGMQAKDVFQEGDPEATLFATFEGLCSDFQSLTFDQLPYLFLKLLPMCSWYLSYRHILVDEAQDMNPVQWEIVRLMSNLLPANTFLVGDVDQSIYGFRHAAPSMMVDMDAEHGSLHIISNFRSRPGIVEAANSLIRKNQMRIPHTMSPERDPTDAQDVWVARGCDTDRVASTILPGVLRRFSHGDVAILARTHVFLKAMAKKLDEYAIPYSYAGRRESFTRTIAFARFNALLRLKVNRYDNYSFCLASGFFGVDSRQLGNIRSAAIKHRLSLYDAWLMDEPGPPDEYFGKEVYSPGDILAALLDNGQLLPDDGRQILSILKMSEDAGAQPEILSYLDWVAHIHLDDFRADEPKDRVTLMTIHGAKGLEWPAVILLAANEGVLPSKQSLDNDDAVEEERRLAYVACTRARETLYVTARPDISEKDGRVYETPVSRFIDEMGV